MGILREFISRPVPQAVNKVVAALHANPQVQWQRFRGHARPSPDKMSSSTTRSNILLELSRVFSIAWQWQLNCQANYLDPGYRSFSLCKSTAALAT
jgi:hypothetical protein